MTVSKLPAIIVLFFVIVLINIVVEIFFGPVYTFKRCSVWQRAVYTLKHYSTRRRLKRLIRNSVCMTFGVMAFISIVFFL
jgi:hypothetical protein